MSIATNLAAAMKLRQMSSVKLCAAIEDVGHIVPPDTLKSHLTGKRVPRSDTLALYATVLGVTADQLLYDSDRS